MMKKTLEEKLTYLIDFLDINEQFIDGAVMIGGWNADTIDRIIYYDTGYQTFEDWFIEEVLNGEW